MNGRRAKLLRRQHPKVIVASPELSPDERVAAARLTLLKRADRAVKRASRAAAGSNAREAAIELARLLSACAHEIEKDKTLRQTIAVSGWDCGWRALQSRVVAHVREREAAGKKKIREALKGV